MCVALWDSSGGRISEGSWSTSYAFPRPMTAPQPLWTPVSPAPWWFNGGNCYAPWREGGRDKADGAPRWRGTFGGLQREDREEAPAQEDAPVSKDGRVAGAAATGEAASGAAARQPTVGRPRRVAVGRNPPPTGLCAFDLMDNHTKASTEAAFPRRRCAPAATKNDWALVAGCTG